MNYELKFKAIGLGKKESKILSMKMLETGMADNS